MIPSKDNTKQAVRQEVSRAEASNDAAPAATTTTTTTHTNANSNNAASPQHQHQQHRNMHQLPGSMASHPGGGNNMKMSGGTSGSSTPSSMTNGCVRWCMNVALQSFAGEPWAVNIGPVTDFGSSSFSVSPMPAAGEHPTRPTAQTTTSATRAANDSGVSTPPLHPQHAPPGTVPQSGGVSMTSSATPFPNATYGSKYGSGSTAAARCGMQLSVVDWDPEEIAAALSAMDGGSGAMYSPPHEEVFALQQCVMEVNDPPITYGSDELLTRISNVEFSPLMVERTDPETGTVESHIHYTLRTPIEPLLHATASPAVTATVEHCVTSMILVYGATQEMKQMGLIGTPEECGLLPHAIRQFMEKYVSRKEHQQQQQSQTQQQRRMSGSSSNVQCSATADASTTSSPQSECSEGSRSTSRSPHAMFPPIGSSKHRFVRVESSFIAFDSSSVVDLLDLDNKHVELVLQLAPPPAPAAFEESMGGEDMPTLNTATTDSFVLYAHAMPAESTNDALSALDVGLENLSRALERGALLSESGSSLLFSITAYTDTCRCATMHVLCLAEDPAAQTWLASTVNARSQAIPLGEEQSWASIQNTPMPPPLHHHAATMLVPSLCFGNMFTSVLMCVYNSMTALSRLNRDLTFALTGYRMRTIPKVTLASTRRGGKVPLPAGWEEHFTEDGRRYFTETSTLATTWEDPRFAVVESAVSSGRSTRRSSARELRQSRIGLGEGDRDYLSAKLQHTTSAAGAAMSARGSSAASPPPLDVGIVVVDTHCRPRVVLHANCAEFSSQVAYEHQLLREKQRRAEELAERERAAAQPVAVLDTAPTSNNETYGMSTAVTSVNSPDAPTASLHNSHPLEVSTNNGLMDGAGASGLPSHLELDDTAIDSDPDAALIEFTAITSPTEEMADDVVMGGDVNDTIHTTKFYTNALQHQIASPTSRGVGGGAGGAAGAGGACGVSTGGASAADLGASVTSHSGMATAIGTPEISTAAVSTTSVMLSPDAQDLESLVDEFAHFFRRAYHSEQRVAELEEELDALRRSAAGSSKPAVVAVPAAAAPTTTTTTSINSATTASSGHDCLCFSKLLDQMDLTLGQLGTATLRQRLHPAVNRARKHYQQASLHHNAHHHSSNSHGSSISSAPIMELWLTALQQYKEAEAQVRDVYHRRYTHRVAQLAQDGAALLLEWGQDVNADMDALRQENKELRQALAAATASSSSSGGTIGNMRNYISSSTNNGDCGSNNTAAATGGAIMMMYGGDAPVAASHSGRRGSLDPLLACRGAGGAAPLTLGGVLERHKELFAVAMHEDQQHH